MVASIGTLFREPQCPRVCTANKINQEETYSWCFKFMQLVTNSRWDDLGDKKGCPCSDLNLKCSFAGSYFEACSPSDRATLELSGGVAQVGRKLSLTVSPWWSYRAPNSFCLPIFCSNVLWKTPLPAPLWLPPPWRTEDLWIAGKTVFHQCVLPVWRYYHIKGEVTSVSLNSGAMKAMIKLWTHYPN